MQEPCRTRNTKTCVARVGIAGRSRQIRSCVTFYPPKMREIALWPFTNGSIADFQYCLVVLPSLLRLLRVLGTNVVVYYNLAVNSHIRVSKTLYQWTLSLASFRLCETQYWARGSEAQRAEAAARHRGRSTFQGFIHPKKWGPNTGV